MAALAPAFLGPIYDINDSVVDQPAQQRAKGRERQASCVVMIPNFTAATGVDEQTTLRLVSSSGVAGRAAQEVLGLDPETYQKSVGVEVGPRMTQRDLFLHLSAGLDADAGGGANAAQRYLAAVVKHLSEVIADAVEAHKAGIAGELKGFKEGNAQVEQDLAGVTRALQDLRTRPGLKGMSPQELRYEGARLRQEVNNLRSNLSSVRLQQAVAPPRPLDFDPPSRQELTAAWQKVVDFREAKLEELRARAEKEPISAVQLAEFEAGLVEARAQLEAYSRPRPSVRGGIGPRGLIQAQPGGGSTEGMEAMLAQAEQRLEKFDAVGANRVASELEARENEERALQERLAALRKQIADSEQTLRLADAFSIKILGADGKSAPPPGM
jgi:hypothetical protein